jgi:putative membrane protein
MQKTKFILTAGALALALSAGFAQAQTTGTGSSVTGGGTAPAAQPSQGTQQREVKKDDKLARGDRKFVQEAAGSGMFEVQVSQLAATKAVDPNVKSYASMLVDHHTAANNELIQLANMKGVELPAAPPRGLRKEIEKIGKKSGADLDKEYIKEVGIKAHEKDIKMFEKASKDLKDPQLKAFADKTLPTLRQHLAAAQALQGGKGHAAHPAAMGAPANTAAPGAVPGSTSGSLSPKGKGS